jgi:hypothetical protein
MTGSALTDERLVELREAARREASDGRFIDPVLFRQTAGMIGTVPADWLMRVYGEPFASRSQLPWWVSVLVLRAREEDAAHLAELEAARTAAAQRIREEEAAAARAQGEAQLSEWRALQERLPVRTFAAHNWTVGHYDGYVSGADHIVVLEPLDVGRLHRATGKSLCETPSKARSGTARRPNPLRHLENDPDSASDPNRIPTCRACLRIAERLAGARA